MTDRSHDAGRQWREPVAPSRKKHIGREGHRLSPHIRGQHPPRLLLYSGCLSFLEMHYPTLRDNLYVLLNDGFNDGSHSEKKTIAKNMLNKNIEDKLISEVTGLTLEQINNLK